MKDVVRAKVTMACKDAFLETAKPNYPPGAYDTYRPVEVDRQPRERQDARRCPDVLETNDPQIQVALDGAFVMVRFVHTEGSTYERYVGGMNLDFSAFEDGEARARKIAEAFLS